MKKIILIFIILFNGFTFASDTDRRHDIFDKKDLAKEIIYLMYNSDLNKDDSYDRLLRYMNDNSEEKNSIINNLVLYKTSNKDDRDKITTIIDKINDSVVTLKNSNIPKNGEWSGQSGNSLFYIKGHTREYNSKEIFEVAPEGIYFELGYPNFTQFRIGHLIRLENLTGSLSHDLSTLYDKLITKSISFNNLEFDSIEEINEYLYFENANFHYALYEDGIELIPNQVYSVINYEIPHISKNK